MAMPKFFFHLVSPGKYAPDDIGSEFSSVAAAWLDAFQAATEMSCDLIRQRINPHGYQFEITDTDGQFLMDLPFSEVVSSKSANYDVHSQLKTRMQRCRELRTELAVEFERTRLALDDTRKTISRSRLQS
jgi:hypothetical protein